MWNWLREWFLQVGAGHAREDTDGGTDTNERMINPATGLPMVGSVDTEGNPYGTAPPVERTRGHTYERVPVEPRRRGNTLRDGL